MHVCEELKKTTTIAENPDVTSEEFSLTMKGIPRSRFRKSLKGNKGNSHTVKAVS